MASPDPAAQRTKVALIYALAATLSIWVLNIAPLVSGRYHTVHVLSTVILAVCAVPLLAYLINPSENIPFFQAICLAYGLYFGFYPLLGLSPYYVLEYLRLEDLSDPLLLSLAGIVVMIVGYYAGPAKIFVHYVKPPKLAWNPRSAKIIASMFLAIGLIGTAMIKMGFSYPGTQQIIIFISKMSIIGVLSFIILHYRKQVSIYWIIFIWLLYVPLYIAISVSAGNTAPIAIFGIAVLMLYVAEKHRLPWGAAIIAIVVLLPFMFAKHEYRELVWQTEHTVVYTSAGQAVGNIGLFLSILWKFFATLSWENLNHALHVVLSRFDLSYMFAHVMKLTPATIPYLDGESYSDVIWKIVPRLVYPDKPSPLFGQLFGHRYLILAVDDFQTSINFPQMIEMYVNFGIPGVVVGMFILSQIYLVLCHFMNRPGHGDWLTVFAVATFADQFRIESNFSLVIGSLVYHVALLYLIGFVIRDERRVVGRRQGRVGRLRRLRAPSPARHRTGS